MKIDDQDVNSHDSNATRPIWEVSDSKDIGRRLTSDVEVDVCVIGAGISGLTTAYLLAKEGKSVCVLEAYSVGAGQTGRTTAHFSTALDDRYMELEKYHGEKGARLAAESHRQAINLVKVMIADERIDCDLENVDGYLLRSPQSSPDILKLELEAAHRAGLSDVHISENREALGVFQRHDEALCFPWQLQLHPMKYLMGLASAFEKRGGAIYTQARVTAVDAFGSMKKGNSDQHLKTVVKVESGFAITAGAVVVATNSPINNIFAIHTKQAPYRSYVLGFEIPRGSFPKALFWDTLDPYHYLRLTADGILIAGGEDHKTGQAAHPEDCFARLEAWVREHVPFAGSVVSRWSGQVMEPVDGMAFIGHNPLDRGNIFVITGDSGNGMTHGTLGALLIRDQILGRPNEWEKLYNPARISVRSGMEFAKENANVGLQYLDWLTPKSKVPISELPKGEGQLVRDGAMIVAQYKDEIGEVTQLSAVCPHLGGIVHWNSVEKSWDCPCHGSRFSCKGDVMDGPAKEGLVHLDREL